MSSKIPLCPTAILFDMDGVLVNTFAAWYESFVDLFAKVYGQPLPLEVFRQRFWGRDLRDIFSELGLDLSITDFCGGYFAKHTDKMDIFADTRATLAALSPYRKAVITNTPAACAKLILRDLGIRKYFDQIITGDDVAVGKPDPAIVLRGCKLLGCSPAQAVVVGDHRVDIEAGRQAGCKVIGVGIDGDYRIENLSELLIMLAQDARAPHPGN
ncbi:MAG: HAD family hydrolase [Desulfobulbaceae bacterium]|nr:HAD family hydrolase [Desulfobulbaceae bacterium]